MPGWGGWRTDLFHDIGAVLDPSGMSSVAASMKPGCPARPTSRKLCHRVEKQMAWKVQGQPLRGPICAGKKGWALMAALRSKAWQVGSGPLALCISRGCRVGRSGEDKTRSGSRGRGQGPRLGLDSQDTL